MPSDPRPPDELRRLLRALSFRPERSRPVWRNKHTGRMATLVDLAVNDRGGFQGGMRQHIVVTGEPRHVYSLERFLEHWEPTGERREGA